MNAIEKATEWLKEPTPDNGAPEDTEIIDMVRDLLARIAELEQGSSANCVTHGKRSFGLCSACQKAEKEILNARIAELEQFAATVRQDTLAECVEIVRITNPNNKSVIAAIKALGGEDAHSNNDDQKRG